MRGFWLVILMVTMMNPASADWLTKVWPENADPGHGNPAITFSATGVVVVLPEAVLVEARAAGLSTEGAVGAFLGRYAPRMCSTLLDMNEPHGNLRVDLLTQRQVLLDDIDGATQEDAATALNHALKNPATHSVPRIDRVFVVDQKPLSLLIDYVPNQKVHCVEPPDAIF
jgi:hypothetical protein